MKILAAIRSTALALCMACSSALPASSRPVLELDGFIDWTGAITVLQRGDFVDPYFALQALLLAQDNAIDITESAGKWINWLLVRQKADATFERFCRNGATWIECKTTDADAAVLALWLRLIDSMPAAERNQSAWQASYRKSQAALQRLRDPARGIYQGSPALQEGAFMDNVDVWSHLSAPASAAFEHVGDALAYAIEHVFWDPARQRFLMTSKAAQPPLPDTFYPFHVLQILPLLFKYPYPDQVQPGVFYRQWMSRYRSEWLQQVKTDFAWGLLAVLALQQGDRESAACWRRETLAFRRTVHWTVTDEVADQVLSLNRIAPAGPKVKC